ncbi:hypothetical protein BcDW1_295 [Botrytis cinerea BcDW1]|uniref:Uncharacterized protein n=1 Tax=Botryotinia fuckeliana (strain BcDW1) TaxID=1290391 RepID=M7V480_BOTF1|nr:hypothetical protein BcDW1_295 [Botrytis cinerea BcDW1]
MGEAMELGRDEVWCTEKGQQLASQTGGLDGGSFRALPPRTRAMIGASFIAWGTIGLYLSDTAEKKLGFEPTEQDKAKMPKFTIVEKEN